MDYWLCVSVCLCAYVFSRERYNVQMLRASLSEKSGYRNQQGLVTIIPWQKLLTGGASIFRPTPLSPPPAFNMFSYAWSFHVNTGLSLNMYVIS